ncbi:MAG: hypothetical protein LUG89_04475 [Methanosphaera sp.]|nr:hypothetical protein [Methanosphaera sp.]
MVEFLVLYSEIIPTACVLLALFFLITGILDDRKTYTYVGIVLFFLSVLLPFVMLKMVL